MFIQTDVLPLISFWINNLTDDVGLPDGGLGVGVVRDGEEGEPEPGGLDVLRTEAGLEHNT